MQNKNHISLIIWIFALIGIGGVPGSLTKTEMRTGYSAKLYLSNSLDYFIRHYWHLWLAHLAPSSVSKAKSYQDITRHSAHFKLELDTVVFPLLPNRPFPRSFGSYGYSSQDDNLLNLPENESCFAVDAAIFIMDSVDKLFKLLHMAASLMRL